MKVVGTPGQEAIMNPTIEGSRKTPSHVEKEKSYLCVSGAESLCWKMMHHLHDCMANTAHCMKETWHLGRSPT